VRSRSTKPRSEVPGHGQSVPPSVFGVHEVEKNLRLEISRFQLVDIVPEQMVGI
jgi:hypothetical protein